MSAWTPLLAASELQPGRPRAVTAGPHRLAVVRTSDGAIHVTDLACPHQGYPLTQGEVDGHLLTCAFHNYRFDLRSGACVKGDEPVHRWNSRVVDGQVEVELVPVDREAERQRAWSRFDDALVDGRLNQLAREAVRLQTLEVPAASIAAHLAADEGRRAEWGTTHVAPGGAELLADLGADLHNDTRDLLLLAELSVRRHARRPPHPLPDPADTPSREAFLEAVEARDTERAQAHALGGLIAGVPVQDWIIEAATHHVADYGHGLIYALAIAALLPHARPDDRAGLLAGMIRSLSEATREDVLPAWRGYRKALGRLAGAPLPRTDPSLPVPDDVLDALISGHGAEKLVVGLLHEGVAPAAFIGVLALAAAERMLRFDPDHDRTVALEHNWLDVTHLLTFVDAVHRALPRVDHPTAARLVLQASWFIAMHKALDGTRELPLPPADARAQLEALVHDDLVHIPIVAVHVLKTARAAERLSARLPPAVAHLPMAATWRFVHSAPRQRWIGKRVFEAVQLVTEGRTPGRLV